MGLSPRADRPSHEVTAYLIEHGYEIVGVRPAQEEILGRPCYPRLADVPGELEVVDVFRSSESIPALVDELLALPAGRRPRLLWLQQGVTHPEAEERARRAGIRVVSDLCILREHARLQAGS